MMVRVEGQSQTEMIGRGSLGLAPCWSVVLASGKARSLPFRYFSVSPCWRAHQPWAGGSASNERLEPSPSHTPHAARRHLGRTSSPSVLAILTPRKGGQGTRREADTKQCQSG